jgi:hypothetical protein
LAAIEEGVRSNVRFSNDGQRILATRFFLQVMNVPSGSHPNKILPAIRSILSNFPQYDLYAYHDHFSWYEHVSFYFIIS